MYLEAYRDNFGQLLLFGKRGCVGCRFPDNVGLELGKFVSVTGGVTVFANEIY